MARGWRQSLRTRPSAGGTAMDDRLLHPSRILVVDDQEANALLLQAVLARAEYTAVETLTDPLQVARHCAEQPPDLLLLDWHMPGRSGAEILDEIAFLTDEPNWMPVLVLLRTRELEEAKLEMLYRLALAAEYRDDATGQHAERIGRTSELLALEVG